jgi:hypothetical protein
VQRDLPAVVAQRSISSALVQADPRHLVVAHGDEQVVLVQHLVVLQVVQQALGTVPGSAVRNTAVPSRASAG